MPETLDLSAFACPRCGTQMSAEFYRPCDACVEQLRATQRGDASDAVDEAYEPKMNVTPNAVASKE